MIGCHFLVMICGNNKPNWDAVQPLQQIPEIGDPPDLTD